MSLGRKQWAIELVVATSLGLAAAPAAVIVGIFLGAWGASSVATVMVCFGFMVPGYSVANLLIYGRLASSSDLPLWTMVGISAAMNGLLYAGIWLAIRSAWPRWRVLKVAVLILWVIFIIATLINDRNYSLGRYGP